ncbi:hypothetical protein FKW77_007971 [Venturia effusa]|uniref:C2H2-type domain-containing protein n=1 Tax=Venturia effusa TaxID=50376 RepID=A0A517LG24_9PEZI|nr:hypothetical protein FKW77_007971 [Venturia effusa]
MSFRSGFSSTCREPGLVNVDEEDEAHIAALRAKFTDRELFALFAPSELSSIATDRLLNLRDRLSGSSFGTRSTTPSTRRTSSSLDHHSATNASLRSSMTSRSSLGVTQQTSSELAYLDSKRAYQDAPLNEWNERDEFEAMNLTGLDADTLEIPVTQNLPIKMPAKPFGPCVYPGHNAVITRKGDWVRHMNLYHEPGDFAWKCNIQNCVQTLETKELFRQHHKEAHRCRRCTHVDECRIDASPKLAFACGFEGCIKLFKSWNLWRDHVKEHIEAGTSVDLWKYSTELRNLLRRGEISAQWDAYCLQQLGGDLGYTYVFHWEPETSSRFKRELEYTDLREQVPQLVLGIFHAAVSLHSRIASPIMSSQTIDQISTIPDSIVLEQTTFEGQQEPSFLDVAADAIAHEWEPNASASAFGLASTYNENATWTGPLDSSSFPNNLSDEPWLNVAPAEGPESVVEPFPSAFEPPKMYFPNGVPQDPFTTFGSTEDAAVMRVSSTKTWDSQHSRNKSTSSSSITQKLSSIFRRPNHSRADSNNSNPHTVSMQMNF